MQREGDDNSYSQYRCPRYHVVHRVNHRPTHSAKKAPAVTETDRGGLS